MQSNILGGRMNGVRTIGEDAGTPHRSMTADAVTERDLQRAVIDLARLCGWRVYFVWSSLHSPAGWPDLFLLRGTQALALELKSHRGRLTDAQRETLAALAEAGIPTAVVRPADWFSGRVDRILDRGPDQPAEPAAAGVDWRALHQELARETDRLRKENAALRAQLEDRQ